MKLKELSVATFNLLNLNIPGKKLYGREGWTEAQYRKKIAWTAHQLGLMNADVVGFQELWHAQCLGDALTVAGLSGEYEILTPVSADGRRIECAAIVRKGLLKAGSAAWVDGFPEGFILKSSGDDPQSPAIGVNIRGFSRPVLNFVIQPRADEEEVSFFVCHLKSKKPEDVYTEGWYKADPDLYGKHRIALGAALATIRRTAEATALRFMLTDVMKGTKTPVIVIGDINDGQMSNTANILTEQPAYLTGDSRGGSDVALYTAQTLQEYRDSRDVYYTHVHQDFRESLDHILVSEEFYDNSRKRIWLFDGLVINNDHLNFDDHALSGTNDHGIVRVAFKYKPAK